jgi:hypothetical protein
LDVIDGEKIGIKKAFLEHCFWKPPGFLEEYENGII